MLVVFCCSLFFFAALLQSAAISYSLHPPRKHLPCIIDPEWAHPYLQEESEQVALGGDTALGTQKAIAGLARLAAARGARVGVVLTWAWLDSKNDKFPSFEDMQARSSFLHCEHQCHRQTVECTKQ